jgi:hypothetical protein
MLPLSRVFHNSPELPLIRRDFILFTARCGLTGALQLSTKIDRSFLIVQLSQACQNTQTQEQTWSSSAALCDRISRAHLEQNVVRMQGQRYRFEASVVAFALHAHHVPATSLAPTKFDELIFVGDSQQCVSQALRCADLAHKIVVLGARQPEHSAHALQNCLMRLQGRQEKSLKAIAL